MASSSGAVTHNQLLVISAFIGALIASMQFMVMRNQESLQEQQNQLIRIQTQNAALTLIADIADALERNPTNVDQAYLKLSLLNDFSFDYFLGMARLNNRESKVFAALLSEGFAGQNAEQRTNALSTLSALALSNFSEFDEKRPVCNYSNGMCFDFGGSDYYWWESDLENPWESKKERARAEITYQGHFRDYLTITRPLLSYLAKLGGAGVEARTATLSVKQERRIRDSLFPLFIKLVQFEKRRDEQLALQEILSAHPDPRINEVEFFSKAGTFPYVADLIHSYMIWCGFSELWSNLVFSRMNQAAAWLI